MPCQWRYPSKDDWTDQCKTDLADFGIENNLHQIKIKSKSAFLNLVKRKAKEYALSDFLFSSSYSIVKLKCK